MEMAVLLTLFAAQLPATVNAQEIITNGFSAAAAVRPVGGTAQTKQLQTPSPEAWHQVVSVQRMQQQHRSSRYTAAQRVAAAVALGFAGLWLGGKVGETVRGGKCCDGPYAGFLTGAPIGAAVGATVAVVLTR